MPETSPAQGAAAAALPAATPAHLPADAAADPAAALLDAAMQPARIPRATYRLQFNANFTFADALALVPYLDDLGISHLYASPLYRARPGSTHGYDVVNYNELNPELGTEEQFDALAGALAERGMSILLDVVPNHMGVSTANGWWTNVLKHGPASEYAPYFDIDWRPRYRMLDDKVLLPVLGDHYGRVLEAGELQAVYWHGDFYIHYFDSQFPLTPESYTVILDRALGRLANQEQREPVAEMELASILYSLRFLPGYRERDPEALTARHREQAILRARLRALFDGSEAFRTALEGALQLLNGTPGSAESFDALDALLNVQPYRLAYWYVAGDEINYRRFFDINDMVAVRTEDPQVFADMHRLTFRLLAEGKVGGLRIDHPDGLWDPESYFRHLQRGVVQARLRRLGAAAQNEAESAEQIDARLGRLRAREPEDTPWPLYLLVEKILSGVEPLPATWAVHGTTGYDFMIALNNLFVDARHEQAFTSFYGEFTGAQTDFVKVAEQTKKLVMGHSLTSEIDARSAELAAILGRNRRYPDFTQNSLGVALRELITDLGVYRSYITGPEQVGAADRAHITTAAERAKRRNPLVPGAVFDFLRDTLLLDNHGDFREADRPALRHFVMKFQQITGPVMAKGVEDTAFYVYNRLASLNEVGGHPEHFGAPAAHFHEHNAAKGYPHTMLATSTHDTKRGEDVRARINVLSELPDEWQECVTRWAAINAGAHTEVGGAPAPSRNDEYLLYQTLVGAYEPGGEPGFFRERITGYMQKAINEAKTHSNWINPNREYAGAMESFIARILADPAFMAAFEPFQRRVAYFGRFNALAQVVLKLTAPGVPDIYQGTELWTHTLVDPDNRRPVDYGARRALLAELREAAAADPGAPAGRLLEDAETGAIKFYVTALTLQHRREHAALFCDGDYVPVEAKGAQADRLCAFLRRAGGEAVLVVVPRLVAGLTGGAERPPTGAEVWQETRLALPEGFAARRFENVFTGEQVNASGAPARTLRVADVLGRFPVALLAAR